MTPYANFVSKYFIELTSNKISIIIKRKQSPLSTMPSVWNIFRKKKNWRFKIYISNKSTKRLNKILFDSLGINAQVGVLGHEFSHIQDFVRHNRWYMFKVVFWHLSTAKTDSFEYQTDLICIQQGLGFQLLSWSKEVREKLDITLWKGASNSSTLSRERYMNPSTICKYIKTLPNYKHLDLTQITQ